VEAPVAFPDQECDQGEVEVADQNLEGRVRTVIDDASAVEIAVKGASCLPIRIFVLLLRIRSPDARPACQYLGNRNGKEQLTKYRN